MEMKIKEELGRVPVTVVEVSGRINLGSAEELEQKVRDIHKGGGKNLILDLSAVQSVTSAGLRAILAIYKLYSDEGDRSASGTSAAAGAGSRHFVLLDPAPEVLKVIRIAGFDRYLKIYADRQEALTSFK